MHAQDHNTRTHHDLLVWQAAVELSLELYLLTKRFPPQERFGMTAQINRAGVSAASNIAEGAARKSTKEFLQFLYVARGSLSEVQTQLLIAQRAGLIADCRPATEKLDDTFRLLNSLIRSLKSHNPAH